MIQQIGNGIHPSIMLKIDVPSNYPDKKLLILDLKVWIMNIATDNGEERKIVDQHDLKPKANKCVISKNAGMAPGTREQN